MKSCVSAGNEIGQSSSPRLLSLWWLTECLPRSTDTRILSGVAGRPRDQTATAGDVRRLKVRTEAPGSCCAPRRTDVR